MALITCPDCGGSVSDAASACIHCGRPMAAHAAPAADPMRRRIDERAARANSSKNVAVVVYALELLSFFYFIPGILAVIIAYLKRGEARGTWVESHFDWLISTFWISFWVALAAVVVGMAVATATRSPLSGLLPMAAIGIGLTLWYLYRLIRGGLALSEEKPIG